MKVIIAGTRTLTDYEQVAAAVAASGFKVTEVVSGSMRGADGLGIQWAQRHGIPVHLFEANWDAFGRSAGPRRNAEMASYAEALILVWNGQSRGSTDMLRKAQAYKLKVYEKIIQC